MAEPLKYLYNETFFKSFLMVLKKVCPALDESKFLSDIYVTEWSEKELKQRMYHISATLHKHLPKDYEKATDIMIQISQLLKTF